MKSLNPRVEALVIGGGPAGAATACLLARNGRATTLLEQSTHPHHKVCGEFLSHEAFHALADLGIDLRKLGAMPIGGVRLCTGRTTISSQLPFPAYSLTRRRLDEELLSAARMYGAEVLRGRRVARLERTDAGWTASTADEFAVDADAVFHATGKHDLPGYRRAAAQGQKLVGFKMHWTLTPAQASALHGWVELFLFEGGYAGLQLVEDGSANLCLLVRGTIAQQCEGDWPALLAWLEQHAPLLHERLHGATAALDRPLAVSSIPYGMVRQSSPHGVWLLGDQAAVIHSFAGDGVSIALHSAKMAANIYLRGGTPDEYARILCRQVGPSIRIAGTLAKVMMAAPRLAVMLKIYPRLIAQIALRTRIPEPFGPLGMERVW